MATAVRQTTPASPVSKETPQTPPNTIPRPALPKVDARENFGTVLSQFLKIFKDVSIEEGHTLLGQIYEIQKQLPDHRTHILEVTDTFPYKIQIKKDSFHVLEGVAGAGGNGVVSFGPFFPIRRVTFDQKVLSPSKTPDTMATKQAKRKRSDGVGYTPTKDKVDKLKENMTPTKRALVDGFLDTSRLEDGTPVGLLEYSQRNFGEIDFTTKTHPASYLVTKLGMTLLPLGGIHAQGKIHRDFKPDNLLDRDDGTVRICDLDDSKEAYTKPGLTQGTPPYLNPRSFGGPETTLYNQKCRRGMQRPCDDMHAFALSGIDLIRLLVTQLVPNSPANQKIYDHLKNLRYQTIKPKNGSLTFSNAELECWGKPRPHCAFFLHGSQSRGIPEKIGFYRSLYTRRKSLNVICDQLKIAPNQVELLRTFGTFCLSILAKSDANRPTAQQAHASIQAMLPEVDALASSASSLNKRQRTKSGHQLRTI